MRNEWIGRTGLVLALLPAWAACNAHPLKTVELETEQEKDGVVDIAVNRDVDILFVIDNSRSMAQEQATLARNFGPLLERLEAEDVRANYRIAVVTTDNGHVHCPGNDAGHFQLSSCRDRPEQFQVVAYGEVVEDYFQEACADVCALEDLEVLPTTTFVDPEAKPRPWLESIEGVTNLPEGIDPVDAFRCLGPQGVVGCGFESPLESMRRALLQAGDERAKEYGFVRPGAILAVVFVTDEADCSARWAEVPDPWDMVNGSRALWSPENAESGRLTSEVCWFGGVECEESPDGTRECWAVDKAADGSEAQSEDEAVLHPLDRYLELLSRIEQQKQVLNPGQEVLVAVLTGVPTDYSGGPIPYTDGTDEEYRLETGIGPGCDSVNGKAAPPVRLAELAREFQTDDEGTNLYSVCKGDYSDAMTAIADSIRKQVRPPCVETCVAEGDPTREGLQPTCQLEEEYVDASGHSVTVSIPACLPGESGFEIPDGVDACYRPLTDREGSTADPTDDMSPTCVAEGWNLELAIERRDGVPAPSGARVQARCSVSSLRAIDCPELVG